MPMGALLSSDVYQYKVDGHLERIDHCVTIVDDIIIYGFDNDGTDHGRTVRKVMEKAKEVGMRFNPTKCQFRHTEVKFFGLMLIRQGVVPDPAKIEALRKLPEPRTENLLQSFLGVVNYLSRFDPKIADLTHNLRGLLKRVMNSSGSKHTVRISRQSSRHCVKMINFCITTDPILTYFWKQM